MVQQVASKIKSAAVFWLIWGILCAIIGIITVCVGAAASSSISGRLYRYYYDTDPGVGGIVYGSFLLVAAIINIIYAEILIITDMGGLQHFQMWVIFAKKTKKLWRILFSSELIPLLISIGMMIITMIYKESREENKAVE